MSKTLEELKDFLKVEFETFKPYFKSVMRSNSKLLNSVINYSLKTKGKQLRPILVFLSAKLCGQVNEKTYTAATLIELLHTASLVHDDVVDESFYRRNLFSVFALWKAKIAVLVGDFFLARGLLISMENGCYDILKIVSNAVKEMSEGELYQIEKAKFMNITEEEYYQIIAQKTGALISACTSCGAVSVDVDRETVEKMRIFGLNLGIAFQIKDDLFDYEQSENIGKSKFNDIQERKLTLPIIYALKQAKFLDRKLMLSLLKRKHKSSKDIEKIVNFVKEKGGIDYSIEQMHYYKNAALKILNEFEESEAKDKLRDISEFIVNRKK